MLIFIKSVIKTILKNLLGLEVHLVRNMPPLAAKVALLQIVSSMREFEIDLILDVGANEGQFAAEIRGCGFAGNIVSFEPLSSAYEPLLKASSVDAKWNVYQRCALGDRDGEVEINMAKNSFSSSILPMLESHKRFAPESVYQGKERVALKTIDSAAGEILQSAHNPFLKIDTQGFEWQVLDGAIKSLPQVRGILVELSLIPLYEGQHLWREMIDRLEAEGFVLWAFLPEFSDQKRGRTLQVNGVFYRPK